MDDFQSVPDFFICPICGYMTDDAAELETHADNHFEAHSDSQTNKQSQNVTWEIDLHSSENHATNHSSASYSGAASRREESCPMCALAFNSLAELEDHIDVHLCEDVAASKSKEGFVKVAQGKKVRASSMPIPKKPTKIPMLWKESMDSCTTGVVEKILKYCNTFCGANPRIYLCSSCSHHSTQQMADEGFGCAYRNLQMIFSSLAKDPQFEKLFQGHTIIPSVYRIQMMLEESWNAGFDKTGSRQLNRKVLNTKKWIGATEIAAILSYLRVRCQIYDFCQKSSGPLPHPKLGECVRDYFKSKKNKLHPLFLQYHGHSKTIVGVEEKLESTNLVILDPGMSKQKMESVLRGMDSKQSRFGKACLPNSVSLPLSSFESDQYQVVALLGIIEDDREWNERKEITSIRMS